MNNREMKSNMLLMLTAAIWGFAFVAQRVGMQYVGAFTFNGVRFALGSISLVPLIIYFKNKKTEEQPEKTAAASALVPGIIAGSVLFFGASLQQAGLAYTTAGKAAFITGLYIVLVPLLGIFLKQRVGLNTWLGVVLAVSGLYFLSVNEDFTIAFGDLLEIIGAFFWAIHILVIDHFTKKVDALKLSCVQFRRYSYIRNWPGSNSHTLWRPIIRGCSIYAPSSSSKARKTFPCSHNTQHGIGFCGSWRSIAAG